MKEQNNKQGKLANLTGRALLAVGAASLFLLALSGFVPVLIPLNIYFIEVGAASLGLLFGFSQLNLISISETLTQMFDLPDQKEKTLESSLELAKSAEVSSTEPARETQKSSGVIEKNSATIIPTYTDETTTLAQPPVAPNYTDEEIRLAQQLAEKISPFVHKRSSGGALHDTEQTRKAITDFFGNLANTPKSPQTIENIVKKACTQLSLKIREGDLKILVMNIAQGAPNGQKQEIVKDTSNVTNPDAVTNPDTTKTQKQSPGVK